MANRGAFDANAIARGWFSEVNIFDVTLEGQTRVLALVTVGGATLTELLSVKRGLVETIAANAAVGLVMSVKRTLVNATVALATTTSAISSVKRPIAMSSAGQATVAPNVSTKRALSVPTIPGSASLATLPLLVRRGFLIPLIPGVSSTSVSAFTTKRPLALALAPKAIIAATINARRAFALIAAGQSVQIFAAGIKRGFLIPLIPGASNVATLPLAVKRALLGAIAPHAAFSPAANVKRPLALAASPHAIVVDAAAVKRSFLIPTIPGVATLAPISNSVRRGLLVADVGQAAFSPFARVARPLALAASPHVLFAAPVAVKRSNGLAVQGQSAGTYADGIGYAFNSIIVAGGTVGSIALNVARSMQDATIARATVSAFDTAKRSLIFGSSSHALFADVMIVRRQFLIPKIPGVATMADAFAAKRPIALSTSAAAAFVALEKAKRVLAMVFAGQSTMTDDMSVRTPAAIVDFALAVVAASGVTFPATMRRALLETMHGQATYSAASNDVRRLVAAIGAHATIVDAFSVKRPIATPIAGQGSLVALLGRHLHTRAFSIPGVSAFVSPLLVRRNHQARVAGVSSIAVVSPKLARALVAQALAGAHVSPAATAKRPLALSLASQATVTAPSSQRRAFASTFLGQSAAALDFVKFKAITGLTSQPQAANSIGTNSVYGNAQTGESTTLPSDGDDVDDTEITKTTVRLP